MKMFKKITYLLVETEKENGDDDCINCCFFENKTCIEPGLFDCTLNIETGNHWKRGKND